MTTPRIYGYENVPGVGPVPVATADPQSADVKAGRALADANNILAGLADPPPVDPPVRVTTIDGVPTLVARPALSGAAGIGQQVSNEDLDALGIERDVFPQCEYPRCNGEGRNQIFSSAGRPLSINRGGELVFGDLEPVKHRAMTAADKARAKAGLPPSAGLDGVVGPSGAGMIATQAPKSFVAVCHAHQVLPKAPKKAAPKRYRSGPYASYFQASRRANEIGLRTHVDPKLRPVRTGDGADAWYIHGDDGAPGYQGTLVQEP